ncbi:hypothetical protein GCM10008018_17700 [Paenibacillus marchantiophytorum]|uniref:Response regulator n=1 Tax=Paenibacillus marchantiophytorum TaxID=1619310 RepID=A0ABQ2BSG7_9BACL|nr:response regulator [Paenibacillus marchantiophytorum]GGI46559.1 hypothetical protein GCM10008018_17700 [Paenibacillus marchantiophytorum]
MYKVLLVDDERFVLESLKGSLDWESNGFTVCGTAENGIEALELIGTLQPDVVFTDIRMPGMSGLEFIKKAKEISACAFVVVSGIAEFSYAQKAITFGVEGYCIKPFDEDEIVSILKKIRERMYKSANKTDCEFEWMLMDKQSDQSLRLMQDKLKKLGFEPDDGFSVCILRGDHSLILSGVVQPHIHFTVGRAKHAIVMGNSHSASLKTWISAKLREHPDWSAGWHSCHALDTLYRSFEKADIASYHYYLDAGTCVHEFQLSNEWRVSDFLRQLTESIEGQDHDKAQLLLDSAWIVMQDSHANIQALIRLYYTVVSSLDSETGISDPSLYAYETFVKQYPNFDILLKKLKIMMNTKASPSTDDAHPVINHTILRNIIDDVDNRFMNATLSIRELSNQYFIHPNYLSQLFKKHLGETFTEYVMKKRIHYAGSLLKNTNLTIKAVGEKSGYSDYFHFTKIFKKMTGVTPSMYRDQLES